LAVPSASGPVFIFCAPCFLFGGTEGVSSRFHFLRSLTCFRRYRGRRVQFSCFARPNSFSAVSRASVPLFMFCAPGLIYGGVECVEARFHVLRSHTYIRRYRGRPIPFLCFTCPDLISTIPRASGPVFLFCAPRLVFGGTEGDVSRFHVFCSRTLFRRYRGRRVAFSCFVFPDSFSAVPRASGSVSMFCAPGLVVGGDDCVRSRFHVLRSQTYFFYDTEGVGSRFHVLRSRTRCRWCPLYWVPF
jgi:hypothetical protein